MATDITNRQKELQGDGDFFVRVKDDRPYNVKVVFSSGSSAGTVAIEDGQEDAYLDPDTDAAISIAFDATKNKYQISPVDGLLYFKATSVTGSWRPQVGEQASGSA